MRDAESFVYHIRLGLLAALASLGAVVAGLVLAWLIVSPADAHDAMPTAAQPEGWRYDAACCHGNTVNGDCQAIPNSTVTPIPGGFSITLRPGEHRLVTKPHSYTIEQSKVRESRDGRYHACLYPTEDKLQCFYAPPMSF